MFKLVACLAVTEAARVATVNEHEDFDLSAIMEEEGSASSSYTPVFPELVSGGTDGSCPAGSTRVTRRDCWSLNGWGMNGETLSNRAWRVSCSSHFTPGAGCFYNTHNNLYLTPENCAIAAGHPQHFAVCEQTLVRGGNDGSCPAGTYRLDAQRCPRTSAHALSGGDTDGMILSDSAHRVSCAAHFVPGAGCFANSNGNVYSTAPECSSAVNVFSSSVPYNPGHFAVCAAGRLVKGNTDGSCPPLTSRVTAQDCANVNGLSMTDGTALSTGSFRVDCAAHFTPGEGCFVNDLGNVYATSPECASAEARGGIAIHHAVCAVFNGVSL